MHYIPEGVQEINSRIGDESMPDPASKVWDTLTGNPSPHTLDEVIDLFILVTERKNRTQKIEELVKKTVSELAKAGFLYEFSGQYYLILNKV